MKLRFVVSLLLLAAVALASVGLMATAPSDATLPADLRPLLEPARKEAQMAAGLVGLLPFRLAEARCATDGRSAHFAFDSIIGSARAYAVIGLPPKTEAGSPGAAITIIGQSAEEFAASPDFAATSVGPCDH